MTATATRRGSLGRRFGFLWAGSAVSNLGDGILLIAAPLLATQLTRSPTLVAGVTVAFTLPQVLTAIPTGVLSDRMSRSRLITWANLLRAVAAGAVALAAATSGLELVLLYLCVFALGTAEVGADTTTYALVPQIVEHDQLTSANSRIQGTQRLCNDVLGAPLAGPLVAVGAVWAIGAPALLFAVAALLTARVRSPRPEASTATLRHDAMEGLAILWRHRLLRDLAFGGALINAASAAFMSVFVLFAVAPGPMGLPEATYGLLFTALAIGGIAGAATTGRLVARVGLARVIRVAGILIAIGFAAPLLTSAVAPIVVVFTAFGFVALTLNVALVSLRQTLIPSRVLGRVTAAARMIAIGAAPLGSLLGGVVAEAAGLDATFALAVVGGIAAVLVLRRVTPEAIADARASSESGTGA